MKELITKIQDKMRERGFMLHSESRGPTVVLHFMMTDLLDVEDSFIVNVKIDVDENIEFQFFTTTQKFLFQFHSDYFGSFWDDARFVKIYNYFAVYVKMLNNGNKLLNN